MKTRSVYKPFDHIYFEDQWMIAFTQSDIEKYKESGNTFEEYVIDTVMEFLHRLPARATTYARVSFHGFMDDEYDWACGRCDTFSELQNMVTETIMEVSTNKLKEHFMENLVNKGMILDVALSNDCLNIENHSFYWEVSEEDVRSFLNEMVSYESKMNECVKTCK